MHADKDRKVRFSLFTSTKCKNISIRPSESSRYHILTTESSTEIKVGLQYSVTEQVVDSGKGD